MLMLLTIMIILIMISLILMMINFYSSIQKNNDREKSSPFECGFDPISSSRLPFSIHFYLISIIFLIFDVEIILLFPMIPSFLYNNIFNLLILSSSFIIILLMGLYIEWNDGALKWLK